MKKIIALLFAAILMVSVVGIGLAGGNPATCKHSSCRWVTKKAATCTSAGTEWYTCNSCGKALASRTIAKKAHDLQTTTVSSTCTKDGYKKVTCKICGTTISNETYKKHGHLWNLTGSTYYPLTNITSFSWKCGWCGKTAGTSQFGRPQYAQKPNAYLE